MRPLRRSLPLLATTFVAAVAPLPAAPPNLVVILADDMGYADLGCYGGLVDTPHLDALAAAGLRFTRFYNSARCSPTRAALLTGLHPHQAGMGILAEDPNAFAAEDAAPGYQRFLNDRCLTLPEALRPAGYRSYLAGKWHLGLHGEEKWPRQRGFDRFYGLLSGASSYFAPRDPRGLTLDNTQLPPPADPEYYTTDAFTDHALAFLDEHPADAPFFLYLSFTAPHWPLHARPEDIDRFSGRFRSGWDELRPRILERQKALGVVPPHAALSPRDDGVRPWEALTPEQRDRLDHRMAVYAAMVHRMDWNIGRLVERLRETGRLEDTLILFLADNGACAEPYTDLGGGEFTAINDPAAGGAGGPAAPAGGSSYGTGWANLSNTPFRRYKARLHEGGIRTPLIAHWPAGLRTAPGATTDALAHVVDLAPTLLELAGVAYPETRDSIPLEPLAGRSLAPVLAGGAGEEPEFLLWEQYRNKAVRRGDWKAVQPAEAEAAEAWELYDLATDPTELHDLAAREPELLRELVAAWRHWAETHAVLPRQR